MIQQIKETSLYVKDLMISRKFYEEKLGFNVIAYVTGRHVFFRAGTSVLLCFLEGATEESSTLPSHGGRGSLHIAFEVRLEDYQTWKEKIAQVGIEIIKEHNWRRNLQSFYFRDPDGHLLEIVPEGLWEG